MNAKIYCVSIIVLMIVATCRSSENAAYLFNHIVDKANKDVIPVRDDSTILNITVTFSLTMLKKIHEDEEYMKSTGILDLRWTDEYIGWNPEDFKGKESIGVPKSKLWTPYTFLLKGHYNHHDHEGLLTNVWNTGEVSLVLPAEYDVPCKIFHDNDSNQFAECEYIFIVAYTMDQVNLIEVDGFSTDTYSGGKQWKFISSKAVKHNRHYECCPKLYGDVTYTILFQRIQK
ncbi:Uncharacterised protein g333 [Pycnogonum litorale]